jgi:hypothetical protein
MNKLRKDKQVRVLSALVEGCSIRATVRMTGVAKNTIVKLLAEIGRACDRYQDKTLRDLPCSIIQCDEIWSFCHAKEKNVPDQYKGDFVARPISRTTASVQPPPGEKYTSMGFWGGSTALKSRGKIGKRATTRRRRCRCMAGAPFLCRWVVLTVGVLP